MEAKDLQALRDQAGELLDLMEEQTLSEQDETVSQLAQLLEQEPTDEELALVYSMGLFNLTIEQYLSGCGNSVSKLEALFEKFPRNENIALSYADGLVNLSAKQDLLGRQNSAFKLEALFGKFENEAIALAYAQGLVNLSAKQDLSGRESSVSKLSELFDTFPTESIALHYAMGLFNLALKQDLSSVKSIISKIEALMKNFSQATPNFLALLFRYFIEQLLEEDGDTEKIEFIKNQLKEYLIAIDSSVAGAYDSWFGSSLYRDIMRAVFYHHHDGGLINHCLKHFGQKLKGSQYEIWLDDARDFDENTRKSLYKLQRATKGILYVLSVKNLAHEDYCRIGHYTSLEVLKHILVTNYHEQDGEIKVGEAVKITGRSRFNNANYMNDTQEGELLDQAIGWKKEVGVLKASNWYLMSLTTNIDDLAMWAQYGKQGEGVALVLHEDSFSVKDDISQHQLLSRQTLSDDAGKQSKEKSYRGETPYRICYLDKDGQPVEGLLDDEEIGKVAGYLKEIREIIKLLGEDEATKRFVHRLLEEIRYLFKSADYKYESEIRFLKYVPYTDTKRIQQTSGDFPPKLYIEAEHPIKLKEIVFGPKVKEASNYVPYIRWCDKDVQVSQSQIHFR